MRLFCHWWQDRAKSMISAMTTALLLLLLIAVLGMLVAWVRHDGLAPRRQVTWFD